MTTTSTAEPTTRRRWPVPRFSLAAVLVVVTLCAVGLWYWFRVPFEVVHIQEATKVQPEIREVETLRRVWGGTIRHGPSRTYRDGILTRLESYQEGIRHGRWEWRTDAGELYLAVGFERGNAVAIQPGMDCDQRLAELLVNNAIDDPKILAALLQNTRFDFVNTPLKHSVMILQDERNVPIAFDSILQRPVLDTPITCEACEIPLIVGLGKILQPADLVCDYRYGVLWITKAERAGEERTRISKLVPPPGSKLAECWNNSVVWDFVRTPPQDVFDLLSEHTDKRVVFDLSHLPAEFAEGRTANSTVTISRSGIALKHYLGTVLDHLGCQARLDGETIVVELQPPDAPRAP